MNLKIKSAIIKRLNLKYYNFKGSTLESTSFKQCKFYENSFESTHLHKLDFKHSSLNKMIFIIENENRLELSNYESDYSIKFNNCAIKDSKIHNSDITIFRNCYIDNLDILFEQPKQLIFFDNCKISKLKLFSQNRTSVAVFNLVDFINNINLTGFNGKLYSIEKDDKHKFNKIPVSNLLSELQNL